MQDFFFSIFYYNSIIQSSAEIAKLISSCLKLFKINKILENTLSLRVAGNGTKKLVTTNVVPTF